jgi:hypothetical protein
MILCVGKWSNSHKKSYTFSCDRLSSARIVFCRNLAWLNAITAPRCLPEFFMSSLQGDLIMAKGQQRKTKEAKKPKKQPAKLNGN